MFVFCGYIKLPRVAGAIKSALPKDARNTFQISECSISDGIRDGGDGRGNLVPTKDEPARQKSS